MGQSGDPVNGGEKPLPHFLRIFPKSAWKIDFSSLKRDFQNHAQIWKDTKYEDIALAILGFCSSTYDIVSDSLLSKSYISGTDYVKIVDDYNDSVVTNCTVPFLGITHMLMWLKIRQKSFMNFLALRQIFIGAGLHHHLYSYQDYWLHHYYFTSFTGLVISFRTLNCKTKVTYRSILLLSSRPSRVSSGTF